MVAEVCFSPDDLWTLVSNLRGFFFSIALNWNPLHFAKTKHCCNLLAMALSVSLSPQFAHENPMQRIKYRYIMNPGNESGLAGEKRGQDAGREMKIAAGIAASLFCMFLFTLYSDTHTQKKNSDQSSWSMTCEITGSGSHRFPALMQTERERRGDFSGLTNGKHFSLLLVVIIFYSCTFSLFFYILF